MSTQYDDVKRETLTKLPPERFRDFANRLPKGRLNEWARSLPRWKGFRPGNDLNLRLMTYFRRVGHWNEDAWNQMAALWTMWSEHVGVLKAIDLTPEQLDDLVGDDGQVLEAARKLVVSAQSGEFTRETIEDWLLFGPISPNEDVLAEVAKAPNNEALSVRRRLDAYDAKLSDVEMRIQALLKEASEAKRALTGEAQELENMSGSLETIRRDVGGALHLCETATSAADEVRRKLAEDIQAARKREEALEDRVRKVGQDVSELRLALESLQADQRGLRESMDSVTKALAAVQLAKGGDYGSPHISVRQLSVDTSQALNSTQDVVARLESNLRSIGLAQSYAGVMATEVISALATGQMINVSGAMGPRFAKCCALTVAGAGAKVISVPIGLLEGSALERLLEEWQEEASAAPRMTAVIWEGINRSAFEAYATALKEFILERVGERKLLGLATFGVLVRGPAGLPWGRWTVDLGPFYDTDAFDWVLRTSRPIVGGSVNPAIFDVGVEKRNPHEWEDLNVPEWLDAAGGPAWRRNIWHAAKWTMCEEVTAASSWSGGAVNLGWLIPIAASLGSDHVRDLMSKIDRDGRLSSLQRFTTDSEQW